MVKMPILFIDEGNPLHVRRTLDSFFGLNAPGLDNLDVNVCTYQPSALTMDAITPYKDKLTEVFVQSDSPCLPCVMDKVRIHPRMRYILLIPASFSSVAPLYPFRGEIETILTTHSDIAQVQFFPDQAQRNDVTQDLVVYQYISKHILAGNGNFANGPCIIRKRNKAPTKFRTAYLKPQVFSMEV